MAQFATLADALPALTETGRRYLIVVLGQLDEWDLLAGTPEQAAPKIERDISESIGRLGGGLLGDPSGLVSGAFSLAVDLFGITFVAAYLLADSRRVKVTYLTATPRRYRRDARAVERFQARLLARHERALPGPLHPGCRFRTGFLSTRRPLHSGAGRLGGTCGPDPPTSGACWGQFLQ